ncbi:hypothetical protein MVEN_01192700 [Mycena venus]|uniref:Uncharacterized protein n=1 Tax=Mycena venus TaxID=2733690 RepID=A0A8H6Y1F1_9AGAR|nr:hypothetical protein MVEN_01192700 [Mycena venus]
MTLLPAFFARSRLLSMPTSASDDSETHPHSFIATSCAGTRRCQSAWGLGENGDSFAGLVSSYPRKSNISQSRASPPVLDPSENRVKLNSSNTSLQMSGTPPWFFAKDIRDKRGAHAKKEGAGGEEKGAGAEAQSERVISPAELHTSAGRIVADYNGWQTRLVAITA